MSRCLALAVLVAALPSITSAYKPTWRTARIGGGGRVTGILMHPKPPYQTYIRTDVGGAYRFNSSSSSWVQLLDWLPRKQATWYGVESIAVHPARPSLIYAALGEYVTDEVAGSVVVSNNAGASFTTLLAPPPYNTTAASYTVRMGANEELRWCGERLAVSAAWPPVLLFGSRADGMWRSPDGGNTWAKLPLQVTDAYHNGEPVGVTSVLFHPTNKTLAFAAIYSKGVFRSTDAGLTWEPLLCNSPACNPPDPFAPPSAGAAFPASANGTSSAAAIQPGQGAMGLQPMFVCRMALTPKSGTLLVTDRQTGVFQLASAGSIKANTALWQDITPRSLADPYVRFCAVDAAALPSAAGSLAKQRLAVATCEIEDDQSSTRHLCQVFVAETTAAAAAATQGHDVQPPAPVWRQQIQTGVVEDAAWWDAYMLAGPFNTGLVLTRKPGASTNHIWLTNNFGVLRGSVTANGSASAFRQLTKGLEEVCVFDVKVLPAAAGSNVLSAVADVDGFTHKGGVMDRAPLQWCSEGRGQEQQCAYLQETHALAYCSSNPKVVARLGHVYHTSPTSSGLAISHDGGTTWPASGMRKHPAWVNTVRKGGLLVGAPYRVAISATDCNNMVLLVSSGDVGSSVSNLVTFDGGATFQGVNGLPVVPRTRFYRDQPLAADTVGKGLFYFFYNATGELFFSKDQGSSFARARSVLPLPSDESEQVTLKARPGTLGEVWVGYPWSGGLISIITCMYDAVVGRANAAENAAAVFFSKDQGSRFSMACSVLPLPSGESEQVTLKARPGVQGEVLLGYPWSGGLIR
uniref:VPS10 domain-containing protein n=1 Tax=Tetradesmus obliquus TaxID=3088 RepID=A0A383WG34_TETOB|eukprot:jgi/Sobl393_1/1938/SZX76371.1